MEKAIGWFIMGVIGAFLLITAVQGRVGVLLACLLAPDSVVVNPVWSTKTSVFSSTPGAQNGNIPAPGS